jgi:hypothetical protein
MGRALEWFAREARIGAVPVQDVTRAFAALIDLPIRGLRVLLVDG